MAPAHCTGLGKSLLAWEDKTTIEELYKGRELEAFTPNTIVTMPALKKELGRIRKAGVSVDNEEHEPGIRCVAAPIRDSRGRVVASISFSWPTLRHNRTLLKKYSDLIERGAREISSRMGRGME